MQKEERFAVCSGGKEHDFYSLTLDLCYACKDIALLPFSRFFFFLKCKDFILKQVGTKGHQKTPSNVSSQVTNLIKEPQYFQALFGKT